MYDLIVLGGGPAGYLAAERAGHAGMKTLVIEKRFLGGVCLNEGCVPSKALLYSAKIYDYARFSEHYGVVSEKVTFDHKKAMARKNKVVSTLVGGIKMQMKANKVTVVDGEGIILPKEGEYFAVEANGEKYTAKKLLIATGSMPIMPSIVGAKEGFDAGFVMTNREILDIDHVPGNLVIVGGGVIGLEMASYFNSVGSKVPVIEMLDKIAGSTDSEISKILQDSYEKKGVEFKLGCRVVEIKKDAVVYEKDGKKESVKADKVLMSIGRRAVTQGIGLENIGVELERGAIKTDRFSKTNIPNVYAAGDVNGKSMLAHTAYREAEVAVNNMLGKKDIMRYNAIPAVIYTNPEVGSVGETEQTAKEKGYDVQVASITMNYSGRYVAENEGGNGICKVIVDKKYNRLIGVHMIGSYASEIIVSAGMMIEMEMRIEDIKELVFPHPTVCEILREAIFQL